jgi:hypothetical protein
LFQAGQGVRSACHRLFLVVLESFASFLSRIYGNGYGHMLQ